MKSRIVFFMVLLLIWIALCSWYYVCKVRSDCSMEVQKNIEPVAEVVSPELTSAIDSVAEVSPPPPHVIYFNSGSNQAILSGQDEDFLSGLADFLAQNPGYNVKITGYADNTGPDALNLKISGLRAENVVQKLLEAGIDQALLSSESKGEADPVADNNTPEGRALNRRVNILIHKN